LHTAQLMPLPLTLSSFSKIQIGFTFLVPAYLGSPGKRAVKPVCMSIHVYTVLTTRNYGLETGLTGVLHSIDSFTHTYYQTASVLRVFGYMQIRNSLIFTV